jgi:outer membrane autotransporter protein
VLGAWVAVSEINRGRGGKGGERGLAATVLAIAATGAMSSASAADFHWKGTNVISQWNAAGSWVEGAVPGGTDRAIISSIGTSISPSVGATIGSIWIQSGSILTTFGQITNPPAITITGIDGVGVQSDVNRMINFFRFTNMAGDFAIVATNAAGGGFNFNGAVGPIIGNIDTRGHTLTFDPVNAANTMQLNVEFQIIGTGNVVKTGDGLLIFGGLDNDYSYTGSTWVQAGTLKLSGAGTLVNSSGIRVDGTFDISGSTDPSGGTSIQQLSGAGSVLLGNRKLTITEGGSNFQGNISGAGQLILQGATTTLTGASTYSGGTMLENGQLDVGDNAALGTGALSMDDDTTLGFVADGLTLANDIVLTGTHDPVIDTGNFSETLAGAISGTGFLTKQGVGTLTLSGANTYTGGTNIAAGILRAGAADSFSADSAHTVAAGAMLDLAGFSQTIASMNNSGAVSLSSPDSTAARATLTVNGAWVGQGGILQTGLASGVGGVVADRLVLDGATAIASGHTAVQLGNTGVLGAMTTGNGIEIVTARNGAATTAQTTKDAFSLAGGHVDAGAFEYRLYAADANGAGENWYLRSEMIAANPAAPGMSSTPVITYRDAVPQFAALPEQLRLGNFVMLSNMHQRVGDDTGQGVGRQAWARVISTDNSVSQSGTVSPGSEGRLNGFQAGTDLWANPTWRTGVYVGELDGDMQVTGFASGIANLAVGSNHLESQYFGAYATYRNERGFYVDTVLQGGRHSYDVSPQFDLSTHGKGNSLLASIEVGQGFDVAPGWVLEPQLQLMRQSINLDDANITGASVQQDSSDGWTARAGLRIKSEIATATGALQSYGRVNVYYSGKGTDITRFVGPAASTDIATGTGGTHTELAAGATLPLSATMSLYGEIGKLWAAGGDARTQSGVNGSIGMKMYW